MRWLWNTKTIFWIIGLLAAVLTIRFFVIDSITILSTANKPQLQPGDNILVSKLHYGPRLPLLPRRLKGLSTVKRGDLLAFNFPEGDSIVVGMESISYYSLKRKRETESETLTRSLVRYRPVYRRVPEVNRCIGLPGDTITIRSPETVTNSTLVGGSKEGGNPGESSNAEHNYAARRSYDYLVEVHNQPLPQDFLNQLGLSPSEVQVLPGLGYLIPLMADQVSEVRQRPEVSLLEPYFMEPGQGDYNIFPHDARYPWNRDNFGPVIVPRKGDSILLTLLNLSIYRRIIEVYENNRMEVHEGRIFINGSYSETYTFKQNYFFVLGDNRHHSRDSRHWGFLPEDHIIGKPLLIWLSANRLPGQPLRISWNRILNIPK